MPTAALRPCRHTGCSRLSSDGFCSQHDGDRHIGKFADPHRGSRQSRGYGAAWEEKRKRILRRDKGLCQPHLKQGRYRPARQVDHIINKAEAKARGWSEEQTEAEENLQAICDECHKAKTQAEALKARGVGG